MKKETVEDLKTSALMATGLLGVVALGESMTQSKTLTAMVAVSVAAFSGFAAFLFM